MLPADMAAYCPYCGAQHSDHYLYCPKTGRPLHEEATLPPEAAVPPARPVIRWEYKDAVFPLDVTHKDGEYTSEVVKRIEQFILQALQAEGADGWQTDEPADFHALGEKERFRTRHETTFGRKVRAFFASTNIGGMFLHPSTGGYPASSVTAAGAWTAAVL